jgi:methyltransferase (TIGR00027 family)
MESTPLIRHVADTAFWVAQYRARETARPDALFRDPFAARLAGEQGAQIADNMGDMGRYVNWTVISRTVIIDRFVEEAVAGGVDAVLNLGAGLDARPYRLALPSTLRWVEVDTADTLAHKARVLAGDQPACKLEQEAVDLANDAERRGFLARVLPGAKRILVLTEGVIPYLTPDQVAALAADLRARPEVALWITEYFHPRLYPYLQDRVRRAAMQNAPFLFLPPDWVGFFRDAGWVEVERRYSGEIAAESGRKPPMPWFARLMWPVIPKRVKKEMGEMSGFILFGRAS